MAKSADTQNAEQFRDNIATVDKDGKRVWIYPKKPSGRFYDYRTYLTWFYLIILFGLPLIKVNGQPFVLINILERKFILFGMNFGPQDFYLFAIGMLIFLVFIILFTVVFGRLFCGWICPQTIFMEMIFRKIEYWIEGDFNAQKRLDASPWTTDKMIKKVSKQLIFFAIAVLIANTFLAYIIGVDEVIKIATEPIGEHLSGFVAMIIFSFVFYFVFSKLREQVCTTICPYGRLQGVMLDNKSLVVAYDFVRGEPRGKIQKNKPTPPAEKEPCKNACAGCKAGLGGCHDEDEHETATVQEDFIASFQNKLGDCIDCKLCVQVCPTGIDIRNGTQLECVNCTACMDACDEVMVKIERPKGLIRLDSIEGIEKGERKLVNARTVAYSVVLFLLIAVEVFLFSMRSDLDVLLLRTPGMLYQDQPDGSISNLYNYQILNNTTDSYKVEFRLIDMQGSIKIVGEKQPEVDGNEKAEGAVFINVPKAGLKNGKNNIKIGVYADDKLITTVKTTFFGPVQ
ncbi:MAG TPA: 4Fe-4S dicluster domain-containing protein [Saprospiraceae bacterium]|nr:4Fe-4S dicluster domain-containing protein [Saprospiraceae bacterium]